MVILGINCVGKNAFVYLNSENKRDYIVIDQPVKVSESLLVNIDKLLVNNGLKLKDVHVLSCCVGPGSFTGIRIGLATVKAFMMANSSLKCVSYNTFEPYFEQVVDGSIYTYCTKTSLYKCEVKNKKGGNITVVPLEQTKEDSAYFIDYDNSLDALNFINLKFNIENYFNLVENKILQKDFVLENQLTPNYVCDSQAERNLKNGK